MASTGLHEDLHNFLAELWNSAEQTGGNSRFFRPLSCWLESCTYKDLPEYMKSEYDRGRVIIYPLFPENNCEDMGNDRKITLSRIKKKPKNKKGFWATWATSRNWLLTKNRVQELRRRKENPMNSDYFQLAKNMTKAYASMIVKNTGCPECDELPGNELCLDCQIRQADADVVRAMAVYERLKELKKIKEKQDAVD